MEKSDSSTPTQYAPVRWKPLKQPDSFRLVMLRAGRDDEQLSCSLRETSHSAFQGYYAALSYAWGITELTEYVTCNGYDVLITKNLHSALRRLRQPERDVWVWCDALCIKQGDDPASLLERAEQLPLMGSIFSSASYVVVDLGDDNGTLEQAVARMHAILDSDEAPKLRCYLQSDPRAYLGLPGFDDPMWHALRSFTARPWFRRIWCVQEAVLGRAIRVVFGNYEISFEDLYDVVYIHMIILIYAARNHQSGTWDTYAYQNSLMSSECFTDTFVKREERTSTAEGTWSISLCSLLISTMNQRSSDRRDRLYALYGMVDPRIMKVLPVCCFDSIAETSRRLSIYLMHSGNGVRMLVHSGGISLPAVLHGALI